jgi:hypothetical protein
MDYITQPQLVTPAYNPIVYRVYDVDYSEPGYKYWYKVFITDDLDTPTFTHEHDFTVSPDISGVGKLDLQRLIASNIRQMDVDTCFISMEQKWNNVYFTTQVGYEKKQSFDFTSMTTTLIDNKKYVKIFGDFIFSNGDQISITPLNPTNDTLIAMTGGIHSVITATSTYIIIDVIIPVGYTLGTTTGTIDYADGRKLKTLITSEEYPGGEPIWHSAINVVLPHLDFVGPEEFLQWDYNNYVSSWVGLTCSNITTPKLLTSIKNNHILTTYERCLVNFSLLNYPHDKVTVKIETQNDSNTSEYSVIPNREVKYYTLDIKNPNMDFTVTILDNTASNVIFQPITFKYDNRCKISNWTLLYQDKFGAISSFPFQGRRYEKGEVARVEMDQFSERYVADKLTYKYADRGRKVISSTTTKTYELNTYWNHWTDNQSKMWEELIASPYVFLDLDEHTYVGQSIINVASVTIKDTAYEIVKQKNKSLSRKTITIQLSNNDYSNI